MVAIGHTQSTASSSSSSIGHLSRLIKNSVKSYTLFLSAQSREKRNLLSNQLSGDAYISVKKILEATSRTNLVEAERLNANNLSSSIDLQHAGISFCLNSFSTPINFREENRRYNELETNISHAKPFSFLSTSSSSINNTSAM